MEILERFLRYIQISSSSNEENPECPSTEEQLQVAKLLEKELKELGLTEVRVEKGYVYAALNATKGYENKAKIGLIAHMDTAPEFNGVGVKPQIIKGYDGGDVQLLGSGHTLSPKKFPQLSQFVGQTLITTDGTTLLGADDKAGIAVIMQTLENIIQRKTPHGKILVGFTPDEEIGRGADLFDVEGFGADFAYTVDGGLPGEIEYQNFNGANAQVTFDGRSIHPGSAKGQMVNSQQVAFEFNNLLPCCQRPEYTEGTEGFFHLISTQGTTEKTLLTYIIRDHSNEKFYEKQEMVKYAADFINKKYGYPVANVQITESYRNMKEKIVPLYHIVENAEKAIAQAGLTPQNKPIRGGTDGARLSFMGLVCPNLGTGGMNFHGRYECITKENMEKCTEILENIL
ncbi:MAG: peptidase T, partial [Oscillospiraceae bacterium]